MHTLIDTHNHGSYLHLNIKAELTQLRGKANRGRKNSMSGKRVTHLPSPPTSSLPDTELRTEDLPAKGQPEAF